MSLRELSHVLYWAGRTYLRKGAEDPEGYDPYDESQAPKQGENLKPRRPALEELEKQLKAQRDAAEEAKKEDRATSLRSVAQEQLAKIKAENEAVPETHDWNEAKTRKLHHRSRPEACRLEARWTTGHRVQGHRNADQRGQPEWERLRRLRPLGRRR